MARLQFERRRARRLPRPSRLGEGVVWVQAVQTRCRGANTRLGWERHAATAPGKRRPGSARGARLLSVGAPDGETNGRASGGAGRGRALPVGRRRAMGCAESKKEAAGGGRGSPGTIVGCGPAAGLPTAPWPLTTLGRARPQSQAALRRRWEPNDVDSPRPREACLEGTPPRGPRAASFSRRQEEGGGERKISEMSEATVSPGLLWPLSCAPRPVISAPRVSEETPEPQVSGV